MKYHMITLIVILIISCFMVCFYMFPVELGLICLAAGGISTICAVYYTIYFWVRSRFE